MAPGFDRGFDFFDAGFHQKRSPDETRYSSIERRGGDVVAHAVAWLGKNRATPFFIWVHLYDPHAPYDPPAPYDKQFKDLIFAPICCSGVFSPCNSGRRKPSLI